MADVAVIHPNLDGGKGGGEVVGMHVLEALQDGHTVGLIAEAEPDFGALNRYWNTSVDGKKITTHVLGPRAHLLGAPKPSVLCEAVFHRFVDSVASQYDLVINTQTLLYLRSPIVQYLHHPNGFHDSPVEREDESLLHKRIYYRISDRIYDLKDSAVGSDTLLANSQWTADGIADVHGAEPRVVYPPVDTDCFGGLPWEEREHGFVSIGRLSPEKRILENIEVVAALRERGRRVHLHVIGPPDDSSYYRRVLKEAEEHPCVHVDGEVTFDEIVDAVGRHRYGLHGMWDEHFGIAVAQMLAGGMIPFVPDAGGQVEVVGGMESLLYSSVDEAVEKIDRVLTDRALQERLRNELEPRRTAFDTSRFHEEIRRIAREELTKRNGG